MPTNESAESARQKWLEEAKRRGYEIYKESTTVYFVNSKRTNILFSEAREGRSWFSAGLTYLETMDVFVLLCGSHTHFYAMPKDIMNKFAEIATHDNTYGLPKFNFDIDAHIYYPNPEYESQKLSEYYNNWILFESTATVPSAVSDKMPVLVSTGNVEVLVEKEDSQKVAFDESFGKWLSEIIGESMGLINIVSETTISGDSGNRHRLDFALEVSIITKEQLPEIKRKIGELERRMTEVQALETKQDFKDNVAKLRAIAETLNLANNIYRSEKKRTAAIFEIKTPGINGQEPAATTYHTHMIRAYGELGDFRNQQHIAKFIIVPYKRAFGKFDYEKYFHSIDAHFVNFNDEAERELLATKIKEIRDASFAELS